MIDDAVRALRQRVAAACGRAKRPAECVGIVAVSKGRTPEEIREAIAAGLADIGENRVQEAQQKGFPLAGVRGHLVGHLQTNKAKAAVRMFDLVHSVDSLRLAVALDREAGLIGKVQEALIEVNISGEASKFGIDPAEAAGLLRQCAALRNLRVKGLMTIAPLADDSRAARPVFRRLRKLCDELNHAGAYPQALEVLSMGMTDDFETAIEEGATLVRLGRAIFEGRE